MVANPYTMVPQALEQTRLTLRDIMNDYVGQKIQESKMKLALAEISAEREAIQLEGEKQKLTTGLELGKIASQERFREKQLGFQEQRLAEVTRGRKSAEELMGLKAETERKKQEALEGEQKWLNEEKTVEDWAGISGLSPTQKDIFVGSYPAGTTMKRRQVQEQIQDLRKNPVMHFKFGLIGNIDRLESLNEDLKNPDLTPNQKKILESRYDTLYRKTNNMKRLVDYMDKGKKKLTPKELSEIKDEAMLNWEGLSDDVKKGYGNDYRKFEKGFVDDYLDTLSRGSLNLEELKREAGEQETGKEAYGEIMSKLNRLEGMKLKNINVEMVKARVGQKINAGDIKGANRLIDHHLKIVQKAAKKKRKKGLGYFGELKRPDGMISTELSVGVNIDGKEIEIPSLVPTLTKNEIDYLLKGNKPTKQILDKAVKHAMKRIKEGQNPFAQKGEQLSKPEEPSVGPEEHVRPAATKEELDKLSLGIQSLTPRDKVIVKREAKKLKDQDPQLTDEEARKRAENDFIKKQKVISLPELFKKRFEESKKGLKKTREEQKRKSRERGKLQLRTLFQ